MVQVLPQLITAYKRKTDNTVTYVVKIGEREIEVASDVIE